ncbi:ObirOr5-9E41 [Ooceraea biroi]|uniref:Odorant receptor n=1 Tax=Ooceraea biroi TaxID=2015173 RepID=A0A3L8E025_OOCBI|nr:ObirOr5-9E41 [Ooceraea biroi]
MITVETEYFNLHRILLLAVGLWPHERSKLVKLQFFSLLAISTSFIVFLLTPFLTTECTFTFIIKVSAIVFVFMVCMVTHNSFWVNACTVRCLLKKLQHMCNELTDRNEIAIIKKYGNSAKHYTTVLILFVMCCLFLVTVLPFVTRIFGTFLHLNESQQHRKMYVVTEYFVDQQKNFYFILLHMYAAIYIEMTALIGPGALIIGYLKHICGMFKIASYRIEHAMSINMFDRIYLRDKAEIHKEIIRAVDIHCKAMEFANFLISNFQDTFVMSQLFNVLCLSLNLYCVFQADSFKDNVDEFLLHFMLANGIFVYSFVANYAGQEIIDHYNYIFSAAYNIEWYLAPINIQKLILFLLQRRSKPFSLKILIFVPSMECFASLSITSISYFTVMCSI